MVNKIFLNGIKKNIIQHYEQNKFTPPSLSNVMVVDEDSNAPTKAHMIAEGYILFILLLYQLSNLVGCFQNKVYPEAKRNRQSPIAPPVASI